MARFCIVTINWNDLPGLKLTYQSLLAQTRRDFRWIVVDGGSTDGSAEWLADLDEPRAEITSEKDRGIYHAMNKGRLRAIRTPGYTLFLNAGDCLSGPDVLERVGQAADSAPVPPLFIYGDYFRKYADGSLTRRRAKSIGWLARGLPTSHQTMYFANHRLASVEFREQYTLSADYCMLIEYLQGVDAASGVLRLDFPLCIFDTNGVSHRRRFDALKEDTQIRLRFLKLPRLEVYFLYVAHYFHTHSKILLTALTNRSH